MNCLQGSPVVVSSVSITCDSAGAYYYGKSSYRDSATCKYGDTANININCKYDVMCLVNYDGGEAAEQEIFVPCLLHHYAPSHPFSRSYHYHHTVELEKDFSNYSIMVSVDAGVYGVLSSALDATSFCDIATLTASTNDDNDDYYNNFNKKQKVCPTTGFYDVQTSFTVSSFEVDKNFHYIPDLRLHFYNATSMAIVGCAQTGTMASYDHAATHAAMGLTALGIGLLVFGTCFGLMLYLTYRRKKRLEQEVNDGKLRHGFPYVKTTSHGRVIVPYDGRHRSDRSRGSSDV